MAGKHIRFAELLEQHVTNVITKKFMHEALTPALMRDMRDTIKTTVGIVFDRSNHSLTPAALGWLSNQFFKAIKVNGDEKISEQIIMNDYNLSQLSYHDIELLRNLFNETDLRWVLEEEYKRRTLA